MIHAVILAGGKGTRFWPLSRETWPKQMLNIVGEDTLLRETIKRLDGFNPLTNIWIVTTKSLVQDIGFHLKPLGEKAEKIRFIIEPEGKNTAPAIGLAAAVINKTSPDSIMMILPSDHAIRDNGQFQAKLQQAIKGAEQGFLVTFGMKPDKPETAYGYIQCGASCDTSNDGTFHVERFLEKPNLEKAKACIREGNFFWNSGIFVWKTSKILQEIETHLPTISQGLKKLGGLKDVEYDILNEIYASFESISIDYGVLEKSKDVVVVPADFGWSDLGHWTTLDHILEKDERKNILQGNAFDIDSENSTVIASDRVIATIGLKDMVVIDTPDATLVSSKEKIQEVKNIVETLKKNHREEHLVHRTVERPWGNYTILEKGNRHKIKRIVVKPKAKLSLQIHHHRSEHWVVLSGTARVTRGEEVFDVHPNESTFIPIAVKHRLENPDSIPLQLIEVQNGDYVEEDDIERFDDKYERVAKEHIQ